MINKMQQIKKLSARLKEIGFEIEENETVLQIVGIAGEGAALEGIDLEKVSHVLQVVIEFEDPTATGVKFLFQGCSLKVYFEEWDLQELAKIIKFNIAGILNEHGIFAGMGFEIPKDYAEVIVP
jgi:hypothetical protein